MHVVSRSNHKTGAAQEGCVPHVIQRFQNGASGWCFSLSPGSRWLSFPSQLLHYLKRKGTPGSSKARLQHPLLVPWPSLPQWGEWRASRASAVPRSASWCLARWLFFHLLVTTGWHILGLLRNSLFCWRVFPVTLFPSGVLFCLGLKMYLCPEFKKGTLWHFIFVIYLFLLYC